MRRRPKSERSDLIALATASHENALVRREVEQMSHAVEQTWEEEVMSRGISRGALLTRRDDLRILLEDRFGSLPEGVLQRINQSDDGERLKTCLRLVRQMKSLDELQL
jgi:hypothetical protein